MKFTIVQFILSAVFGLVSLQAAPLQQNGHPKNDLTPVGDIPEHIRPPAAKVSLIADFEHKKSGMVALYLINTTDQDIALSSQDGDLGCKREAKAADGRWMRCDTHGYSWCGNSYGWRPLKAGHFLAWTQACDTKAGLARPVRFKLYEQGSVEIVSNEGEGMVDEADVQFCRYDALAMRHGPFEDIAAVATGKVQGGQGSMMGGVEGAIRALERFPTEKELFTVVKEVVAGLRVRKTDAPERNGYAYKECLSPLQKAVGHSLSRDELWNYVNGHLQDKSFPWRAEAMEWMSRAFEWDKERLKPVIEAILSTPDHPALWEAAVAYPKVVEKSDAGVRLAALANDADRSENDRRKVRWAWEAMFPNPFLTIEALAGEPLGRDGDVAPLKTVTITNISPQHITLPFAKPESLLLVEFDKHVEGVNPGHERFSLSDEPGRLTIKAGQGIVLHDVRWWSALKGQHIEPDPLYSVNFLVRSPGLWEVPTRTHWGWMPAGAKVLKAIELDKTTSK
jgi:hypothetical protein